MIKRSLLSLVAAGALVAATAAAPTPAEAHPAWIIPALIAVGVGGLVVGAAAGSSASTPPTVRQAAPLDSEPGGTCHIARERIDGAWRRVRVCD